MRVIWGDHLKELPKDMDLIQVFPRKWYREVSDTEEFHIELGLIDDPTFFTYRVVGTPEEIKHLRETRKKILKINDIVRNTEGGLDPILEALEPVVDDVGQWLEDIKKLVQMVEIKIAKDKWRHSKSDQKLFLKLVEERQLVQVDEDKLRKYYVYSPEQAEKLIYHSYVKEKAFWYYIMEEYLDIITHVGMTNIKFLTTVNKLISFSNWLRVREGVQSYWGPDSL